MKITLDLPDTIALSLMQIPEAEREHFVLSALLDNIYAWSVLDQDVREADTTNSDTMGGESSANTSEVMFASIVEKWAAGALDLQQFSKAEKKRLIRFFQSYHGETAHVPPFYLLAERGYPLPFASFLLSEGKRGKDRNTAASGVTATEEPLQKPRTSVELDALLTQLHTRWGNDELPPRELSREGITPYDEERL